MAAPNEVHRQIALHSWRLLKSEMIDTEPKEAPLAFFTVLLTTDGSVDLFRSSATLSNNATDEQHKRAKIFGKFIQQFADEFYAKLEKFHEAPRIEFIEDEDVSDGS